MDFADLIKVSGPLAIGWVVAAYLMRWILARYDTDTNSRTDLAVALQKLAQAIEGSKK